MSIPTSAGGHEDTWSCPKGQVTVTTKHSHEEPVVGWKLPPNILFLPGRLPLLFIDFVVGIPQLDLTI